jgi:hypothetical protein
MRVIFLDHDGVICLSHNWGSRSRKARKYMEEKEISEYSQTILDEGKRPLEIRFDNFDPKAIKVLNQIIEESGAEIVVSSDWKRWADVGEMGEYYESQGIIKKPIAFTPDLQECTNYPEDFPWSNVWDLEQTRSIEIQQYLLDHPEVTHWVAIDDLHMGKEFKDGNRIYDHPWGLENFVHTKRSNEGIKQSGIKEKVLKFLMK